MTDKEIRTSFVVVYVIMLFGAIVDLILHFSL